MRELEERLRTSLERDASKVPLITAAPGGLSRRVRRRQGLVGVAAAGTAAVVVFAAVFAFGHMSPKSRSLPANHVPSFPPVVPAGQLTWTASGLSNVATGHDLGVTWTMTSKASGIIDMKIAGTSPHGGFSATRGFGYFYTPQGTYYYGTTGPMTQRVDVVAADGTVYRGKWMPASGKGDRVWLVALPGSGHGFVLQGQGTPMAIAWPTNGAAPGSVVMAGSDPSGTSFWLGVPDPSPAPYCLALQTLQGATTPCLTPGSGTTVLSEFVTSGDSTITALTVPSNVTYVEAQTAGGSLAGGGSCDAPPTPAPAEWSGRMVCPLWLFPRSGTATLRFYDGSGGGSQKDWPQSHPPMQLTWGSGALSLRP